MVPAVVIRVKSIYTTCATADTDGFYLPTRLEASKAYKRSIFSSKAVVITVAGPIQVLGKLFNVAL
jgi:hypothetical protein